MVRDNTNFSVTLTGRGRGRGGGPRAGGRGRGKRDTPEEIFSKILGGSGNTTRGGGIFSRLGVPSSQTQGKASNKAGGTRGAQKTVIDLRTTLSGGTSKKQAGRGRGAGRGGRGGQRGPEVLDLRPVADPADLRSILGRNGGGGSGGGGSGGGGVQRGGRKGPMSIPPALALVGRLSAGGRGAGAASNRGRGLRGSRGGQGGRDVGDFLRTLGLSNYAQIFREEEIDAVALRAMTEDDLRELGLPMGPRKKILGAL